MDLNHMDAIELVRHVKVKNFKKNQVVYTPGDMDRNLYFILKGKVTMGVEKQVLNDHEDTKIFKLTHTGSKLAKMQKKDKDSQEPSQHGQRLNQDVYFNGRLCKMVVTEEVTEIVDGRPMTKIIRKPHPLYYKAADIQK